LRKRKCYDSSEIGSHSKSVEIGSHSKSVEIGSQSKSVENPGAMTNVQYAEKCNDEVSKTAPRYLS
jgi:hypothetical protein